MSSATAAAATAGAGGAATAAAAPSVSDVAVEGPRVAVAASGVRTGAAETATRSSERTRWQKLARRVCLYWSVADDDATREAQASMCDGIPDAAAEVIVFWFFAHSTMPLPSAGLSPPTYTDADRLWTTKWFARGSAQDGVDAMMAHTFKPLLEQAAAGELTEAWTCGGTNAVGTLALVVVLDQFSRNIKRGTAGAWATDALALALCRSAIDTGLDKGLPQLLRAQLYMPLVHAEDIDMQRECKSLYAAMLAEAPPALCRFFERFAFIAHRHLDVIATHGRFPERNQYLGRASTAREKAYLEGTQDSMTVKYKLV